MKMKINIDVRENTSRVFYEKIIFFRHFEVNYSIDSRDVISEVKKQLDTKLLLERIASEHDIDVSQFYEEAPRPKVEKL